MLRLSTYQPNHACRIGAMKSLTEITAKISYYANSVYLSEMHPERLSHAVVLPARHDHVRESGSSQSKHLSESLGTHEGDHPAVPLTSSIPEQGQDDGTSETIVCWNAELKQFVPKRRLGIDRLARLSPTNDAREIKAKILHAMGEYNTICRDLEEFYVLSPSEARRAVGQLKRLLLGHLEIESAAPLLDRYHAWKKDFSAVLQNLVAASSVGADNPSTGVIRPVTASQEGETASMKTAWRMLDRDGRKRLWPTMVLSALESEPHTLPTLIQSTFDPSWCPSYVVEDVLYLLFCRYQRALRKGAQGDCSEIQQAIEMIASFVLGNCPPRYLVLGQTVLHLILFPLPTPELILRYQLLRTIEHPLHSDTLLHLASRFAKGFGTKVYAVEILRILTGMPGFNLNTPAAASVCTSLLTLNENEPLPEQDAAPDALFEFLLTKGLRPNILQLSALMRNFCIRGHLDTAWTIFELMLQHGIEPDQHVYSILLNASKLNHDMVSLEKIFKVITFRNAWSTVLLNDFLDHLFRENGSQLEGRRRQRKKGNNAWRPMLQLYAKFFDLAPLQKFTLFPLENMLGIWGVQLKHQTTSTRLAESLMPLPDNRLMQPDSITLCLMLSAHMQSILTPKYAIRYYNYFFKLVNREDPAALRLLADQGTLVVDILLRTLMQFRSTTGFAIRRFRKMIISAHLEKAKYGRHLHHHPPSIHTWTTMLNGLKNHNDMRGVVALLDLMINFGQIKPTLPTWNAVIQGFARTRNVSGAVKAIRSLEKAGFQSNDRTMKALRMFPRSLMDQVIARLENIRKDPEIFQETEALPRGPITEPVASKPTGVQGLSSDVPILRIKPVVPVIPTERVQGLSSNVPIHLMRPVITKALGELAQHQEQLNAERFIPPRTRRYLRKESRTQTKINSSSPIRPGAWPEQH
ncbi:hypothetical protein CHU98_g3277 [Xylaria longipes]|nr:hypothetical protein CHU98_g3277 [Xylaria longipes]